MPEAEPVSPYAGCVTRDLAALVRRGLSFCTVYADPPWPYENRAARGAAEDHYRTMTLDEQLTVLLLDRQDDLVDVAAAVARDNPSVDCVRIGRNELATRLGVTESLLDTSPYVIYLQLLGFKAPQSNLAPPSVTVGFKRHVDRGVGQGAHRVGLVDPDLGVVGVDRDR